MAHRISHPRSLQPRQRALPALAIRDQPLRTYSSGKPRDRLLTVETTPMSRADWRAPGAYEELRSLDAPGFAWEYLRRNPEFQRDRARLEAAARRRILSAAEEDAFAHRWGLRFRECCRYDRSQFGPVDSEYPPECDCPYGAAG